LILTALIISVVIDIYRKTYKHEMKLRGIENLPYFILDYFVDFRNFGNFQILDEIKSWMYIEGILIWIH